MPLLKEDPWSVEEQDFPAQGSVKDKLTFVLNYAVLAPSGHNTQPWLFRVGAHHIDLFADRSRALHTIDAQHRELVMSCGAALFHLRVALWHYGLSSQCRLLPDTAQPDWMARLSCTGPHQPSLGEHALFMAIKKRYTNRLAFEDRAVPQAEQAQLAFAASEEGAQLSFLSHAADKAKLAALIAEADTMQGSNPAYRKELSEWVHANRSKQKDGIPGFSFGLNDLISYVSPLLVRTVDWGESQAARDEQAAVEAPALAILSTAGDTPKAWLHAGQALDRVLLLAADYGLTASFLNQPIDLPILRNQVAELLEANVSPQTILRIGYGKTLPHTPRRATETVVEERVRTRIK